VLVITGLTVTQDQVTKAQYIIEMYADTTSEASDAGHISSKNQRLLMLAVVYQTAWMVQHPDVFSVIDVTSATQDGMSWTIGNPTSAVLAPLAKAALARLSWKRNRNTYIRRRGGYGADRIPQTLNTTDVELDERRGDWKPLDGFYGN
jgi:hypothetical protein